MILFVDYNIFYFFVIFFVLLIGLLEIFVFICGYMFFGVFDVYFDYYDFIIIGYIS